MTHSLHRFSIPGHDLHNDYVVLCMPSKDINHEQSGPLLRRFLQMAIDHGANNVGDARLGNEWWHGSREKMLESVEDRAVVTSVFSDRAKVVQFLKTLKEEDLGLSVVVSGLFHEAGECCREAGLKPHTENRSLTIWGDTDRLPPENILAIATMCGHSMVTATMVDYILKRVKRKQMTAREAAVELSKPCMCGIFNIDRAEKLIDDLSENYS